MPETPLPSGRQQDSDDPDSKVGRRVVVAGGVAAVGVAAAALTGASPTAWAKPVVRSVIGVPAAASSAEPARRELTLAFLGGTLQLTDYGPATIILSVTDTGDASFVATDLEWMNGADGAYTLTFDTTISEAEFDGVTYPVANSRYAVIPWGKPLPGYQQVALITDDASAMQPGDSYFVAFQLTLGGSGAFDSTVQVLSFDPENPTTQVLGMAGFRAVFSPPALALSAYQGRFDTSAFVGSYPFEDLRVLVTADGVPFRGAKVTFTIPAEYAGIASFDGAASASSQSSATGVAFMPRVLYGPEVGTATVIAQSTESESQVEFEVTSNPPVDGSVFDRERYYLVRVFPTPYASTSQLAAVRYVGGTRPQVAVPALTIYPDASVPRYPAFAPVSITAGGSPYFELLVNGTVVESATGYTYRDPADAPFETGAGQRMHVSFKGLTLRATDAVANDFRPGSAREIPVEIVLDPRAEHVYDTMSVKVRND